MNTIEPNISLTDLVVGRPYLVATLESLGIDYCCGGSKSLGAACSVVGLDVGDVVAKLAQHTPEEPEEWEGLDPSALTIHLERTHHVYLSEALPGLDSILGKVIEAHGERHPELHDLRLAFSELRHELEPHLLKEERILFPMIRDLFASEAAPTFHCGSLQNPIGVMCLEHDKAGELLSQIRALTSGYSPPDDACASYILLMAGLAELEVDTHLHIHKENNLLFPAAISEESRRTSS